DTGLHFIARSNGNYTLTATNKTTGCAANSNSISVTVNPAPPIAILSGGSLRLCQGDSVTLQSNLNAFFQLAWNKNGSAIVPADSSNIYLVKSAGLYSVTAIDSVTGCKATSATTMVRVDSLPIASTTPTGTLAICQTASITLKSAAKDTTVLYQWRLNGSRIIGASADSINTNIPGSYVLIVASKASGCMDSSAAITLNVTTPPIATITMPSKTRVCAGDTVKLSANIGTGFSYQWRYNGNVVIGATSSNFKAIVSGSYTVSVNNGPLCTSLSNAISVKIDSLPAAFITYNSNPEFCEGDSVILIANAGPAYTYSWIINTYRLGDTAKQYTSKVSSIYSVEVTNSNGCSNISDSVVVIVHPLPIPTIIIAGSTLQTALPYSSYQWYLNNALLAGETNRTYTFSGVGAYKVSVIDIFGCEGFSNQFLISTFGVDNTAIAKSIKVYPNPTSDILNIEAPVAIRVVLRDAVGRTILEAANVKKIDLGDVANGAYLLYISDMEGSLLKVEKVLKNGR
ncbi:MAG: T9SS type A sorting domain-containing protein, partial [Chitinophagaceae bacterium]